MTLEFERLSQKIEQMGRKASVRHGERQTQITAVRQKLDQYASEWGQIDRAISQAQALLADEKLYFAARPLASDPHPMNVGIPAPAPPELATIIATDGSQIMPNRHAAYFYYLVNIGGLIYFHGDGRLPIPFSEPDLQDLEEEGAGEMSAAIVSALRDQAEISTLAHYAFTYRHEPKPMVALLDQRLLYWIAGADNPYRHEVLETWQASISKIRHAGVYLAGYIDKPNKRSVITLLDTLGIDEPGFDLATITGHPHGIIDRELFGQILQPGERSKIFVDISINNRAFAAQDPENEVCFFYLNPGQNGEQIARIDIPRSVADDPAAVTAVHALIYDQCRLLGDYPYVLARADEAAVVGKRDEAELNQWIQLVMQRHGIEGAITAKQGSKDIARGARTRHQT